MPYFVENMDRHSDSYEEFMNSMESEGWALVHVIPGFVMAGEEPGVRSVHWPPRLVFHKNA